MNQRHDVNVVEQRLSIILPRVRLRVENRGKEAQPLNGRIEDVELKAKCWQ
jgi:hypothetical protein